MRVPEYSEEWGRDVEERHDAYMAALEDGDETVDPISGEPFCGCWTCERRESWLFLMREAALGMETGALVLVEVEHLP